MRAIELANNLRAALLQARAQGSEQVRVDQLITYLDNVRDDGDLSAADLEHYKGQLNSNIEHARQKHESNLEGFRAAVASGQSAIRSLFLLNGAASVAMLAFVGHLATGDRDDLVAPFAWSLLPFTVGVAAAAAVSGLTYLSQVLFARDDTEKYGFAMQFASIAVGLASLMCFAIGMRRAYEAFAAF